MISFREIRVSLAALATALVVSHCQATLVWIDYLDQNLPGSSFPSSGGPHWTGVVDTVANNLTIHTWTEIPGSTQFWTPLWTPNLTVLPLVWPAVDANGDPFNVPDSFDGHIDSTFAFISTVSARSMSWNEGTYFLAPAADFYTGWGGVRRPLPGVSPAQLVFDVGANERTMPQLPSGSSGYSASTLATVTASLTPPVISAIPEASALAFGGLAAAASVVLTALRRRDVRAS